MGGQRGLEVSVDVHVFSRVFPHSRCSALSAVCMRAGVFAEVFAGVFAEVALCLRRVVVTEPSTGLTRQWEQSQREGCRCPPARDLAASPSSRAARVQTLASPPRSPAPGRTCRYTL